MLDRVIGAAEIVLAEPGAWLVSATGFLARGGVVIFLAALLQVPSPITVTLIFGVDSVTATGAPTASLILTLALLIGAGGLALIAVLLTAAWADVVSIARIRAGRAAAGAPDPRAAVGSGARRRTWHSVVADVLGVAWLQSLGLLPGAMAVLLVAPALRDVAVGELLLPSSFSVPYALRVFAGVAPPFARAVLVLVAAELVVTIATRRYLGASDEPSTLGAYAGAVVEVVRRPFAVGATWLVGAAVLLVSALLSLWAVTLAWTEVRAFFLDISFGPAPGCAEGAACSGPFPATIGGVPLDAAIGATVAAMLFALVWIAALALIGIASAFRSTLWTLTVGGQEPVPVGVAWRADAHP